MWVSKVFQVSRKRRGFHLITREVLKECPEISLVKNGLLYLLLQHTSASLCLNENADPDVRLDFEVFLSSVVPDGYPAFKHVLEGKEDMSAHIKTSLLGNFLLLPIVEGGLGLGTWQGIYLGEHRDFGEPRNILAMIFGEKNKIGE